MASLIEPIVNLQFRRSAKFDDVSMRSTIFCTLWCQSSIILYCIAFKKKCERTANARVRSSRKTDLFCPCALLIFIVSLPKPIGSINQKKNIGPSIPQSQFKNSVTKWDTLYEVPVKSKVKISQNFMAFSEYMNFYRDVSWFY